MSCTTVKTQWKMPSKRVCAIRRYVGGEIEKKWKVIQGRKVHGSVTYRYLKLWSWKKTSHTQGCPFCFMFLLPPIVSIKRQKGTTLYFIFGYWLPDWLDYFLHLLTIHLIFIHTFFIYYITDQLTNLLSILTVYSLTQRQPFSQPDKQNSV